MSRPRISKGPASANLYCAKCETYIGTFKNEWQHMTSSYASPTLPGEHFEPKIGGKTRTVPNGGYTKAAEGCEMANVICPSCSGTIGQYCVKVKHKEQRHLLKKYLYKLTKVYLMEYGTTKKKGFNFIDEEPVQDKTASNPRVHELAQTGPTSTGSRTPTNPRKEDSPGSRDQTEMSQDVQPPIETFMILSRQMYEHGAAINDNFNRIVTTNGRVTTESARISALADKVVKLDDGIAKLNSEQGSIDNIRAEMKTNYTRYLQHEKAIQELLATVESQKTHIQQLSAELYNIRNQMSQKDLKEPLSKGPPLRQGPLSGLSPSSTNRVIQDMRRQNEQHSTKEESPVPGKRKAPENDRLRPRKSLRRAGSLTQVQEATGIPTPESTQEAQQGPPPGTAEKPVNDNSTSEGHLDTMDLQESERPLNAAVEDEPSGQSQDSRMRVTEPDLLGLKGAPAQRNEAVENAVMQDSPVSRDIDRAVNSSITSAADAIDFSDEDDVVGATELAEKATSITSAKIMPEDSNETHVHATASPRPSSGKHSIISNKPRSSLEARPVSHRKQNRCLPCGRSGKLLACNNCSTCYHLGCLKAPVRPQTLSSVNWKCPNCVERQSDSFDPTDPEHQLSNSKLQTRYRLAQQEMLRGGPSVAGHN